MKLKGSSIANKVIVVEKKLTAEGWQRRIYNQFGKMIVLKPTPFSMRIEKKPDNKRALSYGRKYSS